MKEGWEYKTLGECCEKINGLWKGKKEPFVNVGVIRNANFTKELTLDFSNIEYLYVEEKQFKSRKLRKGDLIVEKSGGSEKQPVGRAVLFLEEEGDYSFSNFTSVLRITNKDELLYDFLYKYLLYVYRRGDTKSMQKATTGIHNIEFEKYLNIQVPILPIDDQRRIVSYLDSSFKLIDEIKDKALKSLTEAKALFQSALAEAMEPKEGWEEKTLKDLCEIFGNYGLSVPSIPFNGIRYLRITDITEWGELNNDMVSADVDMSKQERLKDGDILFARTGATVGKTLMYEKKFGECLFAGYLIRYRVNKDIILPKFLFYVTHTKKYYEWINENQKAAAQPNISAKLYNNYSIAYPPLPTQKKIVSYLDSLSSDVRQMEEKYQKMVEECDALKQAMLRDVFE